MERTLEEALQKIFGGLMGRESREGERMVGERPEFPETQGGEKVVLRQSDYMKIKRIFDRVMQSQQLLDRTLADYKKDLQSLGEVLGEAQAEQKETQETASPGPLETGSN